MTNPVTPEQLREMYINYELGGKFWHQGCPQNTSGCGIMRPIAHEPDRSLIECLHCGQCGYYPVGGVGCITTAVIARPA